MRNNRVNVADHGEAGLMAFSPLAVLLAGLSVFFWFDGSGEERLRVFVLVCSAACVLATRLILVRRTGC